MTLCQIQLDQSNEKVLKLNIQNRTFNLFKVRPLLNYLASPENTRVELKVKCLFYYWIISKTIFLHLQRKFPTFPTEVHVSIQNRKYLWRLKYFDIIISTIGFTSDRPESSHIYFAKQENLHKHLLVNWVQRSIKEKFIHFSIFSIRIITSKIFYRDYR